MLTGLPVSADQEHAAPKLEAAAGAKREKGERTNEQEKKQS